MLPQPQARLTVAFAVSERAQQRLHLPVGGRETHAHPGRLRAAHQAAVDPRTGGGAEDCAPQDQEQGERVRSGYY